MPAQTHELSPAQTRELRQVRTRELILAQICELRQVRTHELISAQTCELRQVRTRELRQGRTPELTTFWQAAAVQLREGWPVRKTRGLETQRHSSLWTSEVSPVRTREVTPVRTREVSPVKNREVTPVFSRHAEFSTLGPSQTSAGRGLQRTVVSVTFGCPWVSALLRGFRLGRCSPLMLPQPMLLRGLLEGGTSVRSEFWGTRAHP